MSPDDERHGTRAGYYAHRRANQKACDRCRDAAARAERARQWKRLKGERTSWPPHVVSRRIQALNALGWTHAQIAAEAGVSRGLVEWWGRGLTGHVQESTVMKVCAVYEKLCMRPAPNSYGADRSRARARALGFAPPLAWLDIDDPNEQPAPAWLPRGNRPADELLDEWDHLRSLGVSIHQAARQLGVTVGAIEKAIERAKERAA